MIFRVENVHLNRMNKEKIALGIIAEYNPFHNGHKYHLQQSLKESGADVCVAVISGNFTQRGEIALLDKWTRAEMAVKNGVNLVVEMPAIFACNNAGYFARGGVEILEALGVSTISFGSELGNMEEISRIARAMDEHEESIENSIKESVKGGMAYPRARHEALVSILGESAAEHLDNPNNILAFEYLRHMTKAQPMTVKRQGADYHDNQADIPLASATAIRRAIARDEDISRAVPEFSGEIIGRERGKLADQEMLFDLVRQKVLTTSAEELNNIFGAEEGLGNAMKKGVRYWQSYEDIIEDLKSKRYTRTRIARVIAMTLLGVTRQDAKNAQNYIRVLAFDEKGSAYLKQVKKSGECPLPIITNINKDTENCPEILPTLELDILAADIYNLATGRKLYENSEFVRKPLKL